MRLKSSWNRRGFLGTAAAILASVLAPRKLSSTSSAAADSLTVSGFGQTGNPYDELGVTTVINCEGTMTMLGGSILRPELEAHGLVERSPHPTDRRAHQVHATEAGREMFRKARPAVRRREDALEAGLSPEVRKAAREWMVALAAACGA